MDKKLIVITGPTAVGKTEACLHVARHFGIPVINADSRQLFRELKIGTAAPTEEQMALVKHYFVGKLSIGDYYSASMYEQDVMALLTTLFRDSDYALLSGGSMMYIDAVCNGIDDIPTVDEATRAGRRRTGESGRGVAPARPRALGHRRPSESAPCRTRPGDMPDDRQDLHLVPYGH